MSTKLKTFGAIIKVEGTMKCSVKAETKEEALEYFKDGDYDEDGSFSLSDCESLENELKLEDIEEVK